MKTTNKVNIFKKTVSIFNSYFLSLNYKKLFLIVISSLLILNWTATPLLAATDSPSTWNNQGFGEWYVKVYDDTNPSDIFGERYTAAQVQWIIHSLGAQFMNALVGGDSKVWLCLLSSDKTGCMPYVIEAFMKMRTIFNLVNPLTMKGPVSGLAEVIGQSPISGINYTKHLISKFNPVTEVRAQGFGFNTGANAILSLWKISRDFCFGLLVLATIVMAFMIMFRVKISPQVVISVQSSIPKLITALILITFSYAIAGFAIDLMYVVIGLISAMITGAGLSSHDMSKLFVEFTTGENAIGLLFEFWFAFIWTAAISIFSSIDPMTWIGGFILWLFALLTIFAMIVYTFKILALIFKTFASIVLTIVTGPFEILLGTVTQGAGFGPWIKKLASHLAVYPLMILMFYLAFFFLAQSMNQGLFGTVAGALSWDTVKPFPFNPKIDVIGPNSWDPPLSTFMKDGDALLWAIVAFVIITMIPKTVEVIQGFMSGKPFAYGTAVGEAMGPIMGLKKNMIDPITGSYQQAIGRDRVKAFQRSVRARTQASNLPPWLKQVILANPGNE